MLLGKMECFEPQFTLVKSEGYRDHGLEKGSWHLSFIHQHMLKFSFLCGFSFPPLSWPVSFTEFKFRHLVELTARLLFFKRWKVKKVTQLWSALLALDHILAYNLWTQGPANEKKSCGKCLQVGCGSTFTNSCSQMHMLVSIMLSVAGSMANFKGYF